MDDIIQKLFGYFINVQNITAEEYRESREAFVGDLQNLTHYAVHGNFVLIRTVKGRCLVERRDIDNVSMMGFVYREHNSEASYAFWCKKENVEFMGPLLRGYPGRRVKLEELMVE